MLQIQQAKEKYAPRSDQQLFSLSLVMVQATLDRLISEIATLERTEQ